MTARIGAVALLLFWGFPSLCQAQSRVDVLQILDNFLASRIAAVHCKTANPASDARFYSNLNVVTIRAGEAFRQRNPGLGEAEAAKRLKARMEAAAGNAKRIVANGCSSDRATTLLKLYDMHAAMSF